MSINSCRPEKFEPIEGLCKQKDLYPLITSSSNWLTGL